MHPGFSPPPKRRRRKIERMILEGSELLSVLANRVCNDQQAEIKRLRVENRFLRDTGRVSVVIEGPDGFGADSVLATATLSQRECLEQRSLGNDVVRVTLSPTVRVWRLGSLLDSRLVLRKRATVVETKEVAELAQRGRMRVHNDGRCLRRLKVQFSGGDGGVFSSLRWVCRRCDLSDAVPVPEEGNQAEWSGGPPEWLAAHRDQPVLFGFADVSLEHLFGLHDSDDKGEDDGETKDDMDFIDDEEQQNNTDTLHRMCDNSC